ncbi:MAG: hypothetical protein NT075_24510 [Chloroflexi bacterium]|nr:hypothetical protein [Chloroflexota bacterium]
MKLYRIFLVSGGLLIACLFSACIQPIRPATTAPSTNTTILCTPSGAVRCYPSPDQQWVAVMDISSGSLSLTAAAGTTQPIFPAGNWISAAIWSPDSKHLIVAQTSASQPTQLWQLDPSDHPIDKPLALFTSPDPSPEGIVFGDWSPNHRYLLFWVDPAMSASILADGTPLRVLDIQTGQAQLITADGPLGQETVALLNPRYHSWAPDSSQLAVTLGGYRSAQINKWLALYDPTAGTTTVVVSDTEQIPGIVAWSPKGDQIAYAAVAAREISTETADLTTFDNPPIAGRRIYLLDPKTGQQAPLNAVAIFQDAPLWKADGSLLYYVQRDGDHAIVMAADPVTKGSKPVDVAPQLLSDVPFYYGQFDWKSLLDAVRQ